MKIRSIIAKVVFLTAAFCAVGGYAQAGINFDALPAFIQDDLQDRCEALLADLIPAQASEACLEKRNNCLEELATIMAENNAEQDVERISPINLTPATPEQIQDFLEQRLERIRQAIANAVEELKAEMIATCEAPVEAPEADAPEAPVDNIVVDENQNDGNAAVEAGGCTLGANGGSLNLLNGLWLLLPMLGLRRKK